MPIEAKAVKPRTLARRCEKMKLHELSPVEGATKAPKRIGRGHGSGNGKTAGKGHKGQKARAGHGMRPGFEGGQMPLQRRVPKRGFNNIFATEYAIVNVSDLESLKAGKVTLETLKEAGIVKTNLTALKVLGNGTVTKKFTVVANKFSKSAQKAIEDAGGKIEVI